MPQDRAGRSTVLITGSSGFLGQAIARRLGDRYQIIGLDLKKPRQPVAGMDTIEIDLTSKESVDAAVKEASNRAGGPIASVIHLAAYYDTTGEDDPRYDAVTVQGTRRLLDALKTVGVEQLVFSSTRVRLTPARPCPPAESICSLLELCMLPGGQSMRRQSMRLEAPMTRSLVRRAS